MHGNDCYSVDVHLSAFLLPADKEREITSDECCPRKAFIFQRGRGKKEVVKMGGKCAALLRPANILFDFTQVH